MRLRITFAKTEAMRFTSHLDLHRTWERTFRRANLPLAYSQGFNPHPHLNLACALPLGFTSQCEVIDAWLENPLPIPDIEAALVKACPPGIQISQIIEASANAPTLQTELEATQYTVTLLDPLPGLEVNILALLEAEHLPRIRRGKGYDLRPLILVLHTLPEDEHGCQRLSVQLAALPGATGRPEEVLAALGASPEAARCHRVKLIFRQEGSLEGKS